MIGISLRFQPGAVPADRQCGIIADNLQDQGTRTDCWWVTSGWGPITSLLIPQMPPSADPSQPDIIEEALDLFRANCLFRNFEIKGPADRLLIYLILFISDCLTKLAPSAGRPSPAYPEAFKQLSTLSVDHFSLPGEAGFPLNSLYHGPKDKNEAGEL